MSRLVKIRARPALDSPILLATWPGVGNVSMIVAGYLQRKLAFKPLGEIEASYFFDPIGVTARDNVVEAPQFPQSRFYYRKGDGDERDLILFVGDDQPSSKVYELAGAVLDIGIRFRADKVLTCAAAPTRIHFTESPRVWGVVTSRPLMKELREYDLVQGGNIQIAGLNGLLLGMAKERGVGGVCLLAEVPAHTPRMENPMAALAILKILTRILHIEIDTTELSDSARDAREQMKLATSIAMGEYLEHFTQPIWQQADEDADDGDQDDDYED